MKLFEKYKLAFPNKQHRRWINATIIFVLALPILRWTGNIYYPCKCANITEQSPMAGANKDKYSAEDWNNASDPYGKIQGDVDDYISLAKECAYRYGELDDFEKEIIETSQGTEYIPFTKIEINASKKCDK